MDYSKRKHQQIYQQNTRKQDVYDRGIGFLRKKKDEVRMEVIVTGRAVRNLKRTNRFKIHIGTGQGQNRCTELSK